MSQHLTYIRHLTFSDDTILQFIMSNKVSVIQEIAMFAGKSLNAGKTLIQVGAIVTLFVV